MNNIFHSNILLGLGALLTLINITTVQAMHNSEEDFLSAKNPPSQETLWQFPDREKIAEVIKSTMGGFYFDQKTELSQKLENSIKSKIGVEVAVELAYCNYYEYMRNTMPRNMLPMGFATAEMNKKRLIKSLLELAKESH